MIRGLKECDEAAAAPISDRPGLLALHSGSRTHPTTRPVVEWALILFSSSGFTVKEYSPQRRSVAKPQPNVGVSRAKMQRPQRKKRSELGVLGALARGISESESLRLPEHLRKLRKFSTIVL